MISPERKAALREFFEYEHPVREALDALDAADAQIELLEEERTRLRDQWQEMHERMTRTTLAEIENYNRADAAEARIAKLEAALAQICGDVSLQCDNCEQYREIAREALVKP